MNLDMERASFTSLLDHAQFGGALQVQHQSLMHPHFQGMMSQPMSMGSPQFSKQQAVQQVPALASAPPKLPKDQSVPNVLQNMMKRSDSSKLTPSSVEASLLSLVDGELRVQSISNLSIFLQIVPRCKTEPEQTLALVVLRATSTANDVKLSHACAGAFEKNGGLRLARAWVDSAATWQHNDLLVLLLEVLQTLPLQLTSITEARINEPIVKLRKNARDERVKRAAQDLLKFWRSKFTEKEQASTPSSTATEKKPHDSCKSSSSPTAATKSSSSATQASAKLMQAKQPKVLKKRSIKRLERLPFGGGSSVSKSSDLIDNLIQRKSAKDASIAAVAKKGTSVDSSDNSDEVKPQVASSSQESPTAVNTDEDALTMPLPTIQSFKVALNSSVSSKERKRIRWADDNGAELVKVQLIESWRDLVPFDPRHDDQSFMDAKLREHANEKHALQAQHHRIPPAVAASLSREWTTPAFIRLSQALAARVNSNIVTDEMHVQDSRRRHVDEYEVLAGEMPSPSPKEWERLNEPHRGPPVEIPLSDAVESEPKVLPPPASAPLMAPPPAAAPGFGRPPGWYGQAPGYNYHERPDFNGRQVPDADRKLREALGPLQENTVLLLLNNPDVVPQVLDEAQRHGNRIPDARVFEIVDHYRRGRFQAPPNAGGPPAFSPYHSQQQHQYGLDMSPGMGYDYQYQQYPPQQGPPGGLFMPNKRKADAMGSSQDGLMADASQSFKRSIKKRGTQPCKFFASPMGCKHGGNCHYAHNQPALPNGPAFNGIYNNNIGPMMGVRPMMGGRGPGQMERYSAGFNHHMRGGQ